MLPAAKVSDATPAGRVLHLDGLRCVAILLVIGFHYFSRWTSPLSDRELYPYGDVFARFPIFEYGYFGVELFFVISGYVIALTLFRCNSLGEFAVRRFARLWPAMALCSLLTFCVLHALPGAPFSASAKSFLPSLIFIDPWIVERLTGLHGLNWMDGVYWSLYVEVRFYVVMAILYFASPRQFARNLSFLGLGVFSLEILNLALHSKVLEILGREILIAEYLGWFLLGAAFYLLGRADRSARPTVLVAAAILNLALEAVKVGSTSMAIAIVLIPLLFIGAFRLPGLRSMLSWPAVTSIGAASYSLYLLHQQIGVSLIGVLGRLTGLERSPIAGALAAIVGASLVFAAHLVYRYWEAPLNRAIVSFARSSAVRGSTSAR